MRKMAFVLVCILSFCMLAGCWQNTRIEPITEVPTMEELSEFRDTHTPEEYSTRLMPC